MDNKIFRINGQFQHGTYDLELAVELAMRQSGWTESNKLSITGWSVSQHSGLLLHWSENNASSVGYNKFPSPIRDAKKVGGIIVDWLSTDEALDTEFDPWTENIDHDGHNTLGFLLYKRDWGMIDNDWTIMFGVKPSYLWHGK
jgi:hypothetical protein